MTKNLKVEVMMGAENCGIIINVPVGCNGVVLSYSLANISM